MQNPNLTIHVAFTVELAQETLISLRDRQHVLGREMGDDNLVIRQIARNQYGRVLGAIAALEDALQAVGVPA